MPSNHLRRLSLIALLIIAGLTSIAFFTLPVTAAPRAQNSLPNFRVTANSVISVTVAITDGQVIVVPIDLNIVAQNLQGASELSIIADTEQQAGIFVGVVASDPVPATVQPTDASGATPTPAPTTAASPTTDAPATSNTNATHTANANSNLRAGPGTNFDIVGRIPEGGTMTVVGQNDDGSWLQLDDGNWIAEFLADPITPGSIPPSEDDDAASDDAASDDVANDDVANDDVANDNATGDDSDTDDDAAQIDDAPPAISNQAELAVYLVSLAEIGATASDAVTEMRFLMDSPQPLNPQWRNDVSVQLNELSTALDQYLALTPVPGYEDLHAEVTAVAVGCEDAVNYLVAGLDNPLSINPSTATQLVQQCASQATDLAAYLETVE